MRTARATAHSAGASPSVSGHQSSGEGAERVVGRTRRMSELLRFESTFVPARARSPRRPRGGFAHRRITRRATRARATTTATAVYIYTFNYCTYIYLGTTHARESHRRRVRDSSFNHGCGSDASWRRATTSIGGVRGRARALDDGGDERIRSGYFSARAHARARCGVGI